MNHVVIVLVMNETTKMEGRVTRSARYAREAPFTFAFQCLVLSITLILICIGYWKGRGESRHAAKELVGAGADSSDERGDEW